MDKNRRPIARNGLRLSKKREIEGVYKKIFLKQKGITTYLHFCFEMKM